jgi:hypothetical protein
MWNCVVDIVATLCVLLLHLNFIMAVRCLRWGVRRVTECDGERMQTNGFLFLLSFAFCLPSETLSGM